MPDEKLAWACLNLLLRRWWRVLQDDSSSQGLLCLQLSFCFHSSKLQKLRLQFPVYCSELASKGSSELLPRNFTQFRDTWWGMHGKCEKAARWNQLCGLIDSSGA